MHVCILHSARVRETTTISHTYESCEIHRRPAAVSFSAARTLSFAHMCVFVTFHT